VKLPDFLIVGAMKSGTTTLHHDLQSNQHIFMPEDKEPEALLDDAVLSDEGRSCYAALFRRARSDQVCGEASTAYAKRPTHEGVSARARALLGPLLRVIYVVRDPVSRAISHHRHLAGIQRLPVRFDDAVATDSTLVDYGRYAMQIEPWIEMFGPEQVRVICFEKFVQARVETVRSVCDFLGVETHDHVVDSQRIYNRSDGKPQMVGMWRSLRGSIVYDRIIRPLLPQRIREGMRRVLLPREKAWPVPPSPAVLDRMIHTFRADTERLQHLLDLDVPYWNFDNIRAAHHAVGGHE